MTAQQLQIEILKYLLGHPKKQFSPQQITQQLRVENNKDSAEHALRQLVQVGSVVEHSLNRFGIALGNLTSAPNDEAVEKPEKFRPEKSRVEPFQKPEKSRDKYSTGDSKTP